MEQHSQHCTMHFSELSAALLAVDEVEFRRAVDLLRRARSRKASIWIVGNGGSAATASHFANDLVKMARFRAFAIPDMVPLITAYGNDEGWEHMFEYAMDNFIEPGDVVVSISCSGKSRNIIHASRGIDNLIVMTGNSYQGNALIHLPSRVIFAAMSDDITIQEDIHLAICHALAKELRHEKALESA